MVVYKITFRKRAAKEYIETIAWYQQHSLQAAESFVLAIDKAIQSISENPYSFRNSYKKFFEVKIKKYLFSIIYLIDNPKQVIVITTVFHHKRNPSKKFR